jgi:hypothetical protein
MPRVIESSVRWSGVHISVFNGFHDIFPVRGDDVYFVKNLKGTSRLYFLTSYALLG